MRFILKYCILVLVLGYCGYRLAEHGERGILYVLASVVGLLLFFSIVSLIMRLTHSPMADEIATRTDTWWWMVAVFILALALHPLVSFIFLGYLGFAGLREYYSLMDMEEKSGEKTLSFKDRTSILLTYLAIPLTVYVAYIKWYELFIIMVPVYLFLLIPILFVLQNRSEGTLKSLGAIWLGCMFFIFCLGHSLFMINLGAMILLFCFVLTEARDVFSFWAGKAFAKLSAGRKETLFGRILDLRIAPDVSPSKSWFAGFVAALLTAALALVFLPIMPPMKNGSVTPVFVLTAGFLIGVFGLVGDLVFSMIKRDLKVKDSGNILPGHGGLIDRVDSLVYTVPLTFHLFYWWFF